MIGSGLGITLSVSASALIVTGLLWLIDRWWKPDARRRHNDLAGFMISVIAVIYAILLGFVTFTVWENYDKASAAADEEVNLVADIYRDAGVLPEASRRAVRQDLTSYLDVVINHEWPAQMAGVCQPRTSDLGGVARHLHEGAAGTDPMRAAFLGEIAHRTNQLYDARRARLFACNRSIPAVIWTALAIGSVSLVGFSLCFGFQSLRVHMVMSSVLGATIALVLAVVFELSTPFQGASAISPDVYRQVRQQMVAD